MPDFNVRSDSANVEQIMDQIRARIRDKRGVDYTEEQIRELAQVKLERFLDPGGVRSDLLEQFRRSQPPPSPVTVPLYPFEDTTLYDSHRGLVRFFRRLFRPLLKLFFNANALSSSMHAQTVINQQTIDRLDGMEASLRRNGDLYYELLHNMVVELTRMTIEVKNAKMRVESIASRLEFNERRARALESAVVYKPADEEREPPVQHQNQHQHQPTRPSPAPPPAARPSYVPSQQTASAPAATAAATATATATATEGQPGEGPGQRSRRRRRRRGRRGGASAASLMGQPGQGSGGQPPAGESSSSNAPDDNAASNAADGRETRPEPFEHAFGSVTHPAETPPNEPSAPSPSAPAPEPPDDDQ